MKELPGGLVQLEPGDVITVPQGKARILATGQPMIAVAITQGMPEMEIGIAGGGIRVYSEARHDLRSKYAKQVEIERVIDTP